MSKFSVKQLGLDLMVVLDKYGLEPYRDDGLWIMRTPWPGLWDGEDYFLARFRPKDKRGQEAGDTGGLAGVQEQRA